MYVKPKADRPTMLEQETFAHIYVSILNILSATHISRYNFIVN